MCRYAVGPECWWAGVPESRWAGVPEGRCAEGRCAGEPVGGPLRLLPAFSDKCHCNTLRVDTK